jgi:hypothetical protein
MEKIVFKHKRLIIENVSPFLMTIFKIWKLREEMARARAQKGIRKFALEIDKEMRELANG